MKHKLCLFQSNILMWLWIDLSVIKITSLCLTCCSTYFSTWNHEIQANNDVINFCSCFWSVWNIDANAKSSRIGQVQNCNVLTILPKSFPILNFLQLGCLCALDIVSKSSYSSSNISHLPNSDNFHGLVYGSVLFPIPTNCVLFSHRHCVSTIIERSHRLIFGNRWWHLVMLDAE